MDPTDDIDTGPGLIDHDDRHEHATAIIRAPSLDFSRKSWWDSLLYLYHSSSLSSPPSSIVISSSNRVLAANNIILDIRFAFRVSNYWLSFFHIPTFFTNLINPAERPSVQPSLILALLSLSILWKSSETELKLEGRTKALLFRQEAQMALDQSINSGWYDVQLAQAAWVCRSLGTGKTILFDQSHSSWPFLKYPAIPNTPLLVRAPP